MSTNQSDELEELRVDKAVLLDTLAELCDSIQYRVDDMEALQWQAYESARHVLARYRVDQPCDHKWNVTHSGVTYHDCLCELCGETKRETWD